MRVELGKVLDGDESHRQTYRHLARFERKFDKYGLRTIEQLPVDQLRRALREFEALVRNWSSPSLADLRSRMAVVLADRSSASSVWIAANSVNGAAAPRARHRHAGCPPAPAPPPPGPRRSAAAATSACRASTGPTAASTPPAHPPSRGGRASGVVLRDGTRRRHENRRDSCVEDRRAVSERSPQASGRSRRGALARVPGDADRLRRRGPRRRPRRGRRAADGAAPRATQGRSAAARGRTGADSRTEPARAAASRAARARGRGVEKPTRLAYAGVRTLRHIRSGGTHAPRRRDPHLPALERHRRSPRPRPGRPPR